MTHKTAQFTPGPWRISECQLGKKLLIQHGNENTLSPIVGSVYHDDGKLPQHANAALIAAAPAMYEALVRFAKAIKAECYDEDILVDIYHDVRDALAQAEGRQA